jgi:hypothetical protein
MAFDDTWRWDGIDWHPTTPSTKPPAGPAALAWDGIGHRIIAVASEDGVASTWGWDGTAWTELVANTPHVSLYEVATIDDGSLVMVAQSDTGPKTYRWSGFTWSAMATNTTPATLGQAIAFDPERKRLVMFGDALAELDPSTGTWSTPRPDLAIHPPVPPPPSGVLPSGTYVPWTGTWLLFGAGAMKNETWEWDGVAWRQRFPSTTPGTRNGHALVATKDRVLMFGGQGTGALDDLWEWTGSNWQSLFAAERPEARSGHGMVYDRARDRVIVFGGFSTAGTAYSDTWEWKAGAWTRLSPVHSPPARAFAGMAYHAARDRIVLFGGEATSFNTVEPSTWEFDGSDWIDRGQPVSPGARSRMTVAYHEARDTVIAFSGYLGNDEMWEWNGDVWRKILVTTNAPARRNGAAIYDPVSTRILLFGGVQAMASFEETWAFEFASASTHVETCFDLDEDNDGLSGCDDPDCAARCSVCGDATCSPLENRFLCPNDCR